MSGRTMNREDEAGLEPRQPTIRRAKASIMGIYGLPLGIVLFKLDEGASRFPPHLAHAIDFEVLLPHPRKIVNSREGSYSSSHSRLQNPPT